MKKKKRQTVIVLGFYLVQLFLVVAAAGGVFKAVKFLVHLTYPGLSHGDMRIPTITSWSAFIDGLA